MLRIHSRLAFTAAWIKIWYLARGLDPNGSGWVEVQVREVCKLSDRQLPTIYEWLREARAAGAIRSFRVKHETVRIYYSSLTKLSQRLGLDNWGTVANVPLEAVSRLKDIAVECETQYQQEASQFAAIKQLSKQDRIAFKLHPVDDLVMETDEPDLTIEWSRGASATESIQSGQSSLQAPKIHRGPRRVFVSEPFIPFGASQIAIARALGCDERTVRRHQIGIPKKQLVQTKPAYQVIALAFSYGQRCVGGDPETYLSELADGSLRLYERSGASSATRPGGHPITADRFSEEYFGVAWLYRTNLYGLNHELTSARAARKRFEKLMGKSSQSVAAAGGGRH